MNMGVLNNCLCLFDNSSISHLWSMQKYGAGESWALKCILTTSIPTWLDTSSLHPVAVLKDDGILMKLQIGNFYIYNQKNMNFTRFVSDNVELLVEFDYHAVHTSNFYPLDLISTGCLIGHKWLLLKTHTQVVSFIGKEWFKQNFQLVDYITSFIVLHLP